MSISSCPRCAKQITIPGGVSETTRVRCPLCNEQYTLADALVHMPPMLLIVEETTAPEEWLAPQTETESDSSELLTSEAPEEVGHDELTFDEEPASGAEIRHADMSMRDLDDDTEVEELGFATSEPLVREAPQDLEPLDASSAHDDTVFELDSPASDAGQNAESSAAAAPGEQEPEVDFGQFEAAEEPDSRNAATIEFQEAPDFELEASESGGPQAADSAADEAEIEFGEFEAVEEADSSSAATVEFDPANPPRADHDIELDFGAPQPDDSVGSEAAAAELEHRIPASDPASAEEIELDFGEPVAFEAGPEPAGESAEEPKVKKAKKAKKSKKETSLELGDEERPRRSLVGTLVSVMLGAVVALPLTLYGLTWLGKDYDFLKIGPTLASYSIPVRAEYSKGKAVAVAGQPVTVPPTPQSTPSQTPPGNEPTDATPSPETPPAQAADAPPAAPEGNPAEPSTQPPAEQPSVPAPAAESPPSEPSSPAPADEKPALAADEPSAPPAEPEPAAADGGKPSDGQVPVTAAKPAGDVPTIEPAEMPDETPVARSAARPSVPADDVPKEELPAPPDAEQPSVLGAPRFAMADVAKAMQEAGVASQELQAAQAAKDEAALKRARTQFYLKMFAMAEAVTFAKDEADGQLGPERQSVEQILLQFASDKKRLDALKYNAGRWLDFSKRTTSGVVVAGTVQSCEPSGQLYEVRLGIGIATDDPVVTVLHKSDPHLAQGDQALLLGAIVDNPIEKVSGYEGLEPMAIWSGMTMKLPAAK